MNLTVSGYSDTKGLMKIKNQAAVELGRKGGQVISEAKKAAVRINLEKARAAKALKSTSSLVEK